MSTWCSDLPITVIHRCMTVSLVLMSCMLYPLTAPAVCVPVITAGNSRQNSEGSDTRLLQFHDTNLLLQLFISTSHKRVQQHISLYKHALKPNSSHVCLCRAEKRNIRFPSAQFVTAALKFQQFGFERKQSNKICIQCSEIYLRKIIYRLDS